MPHPCDTEQSGLVINAVDNAVVPNSHPVQLLMSLKLTRVAGAGGLAEPVKSDADATPDIDRKRAKLSGRGRYKPYCILSHSDALGAQALP